MKPEDIAAILKQVGYKELIDVLSMTDPNLYQAVLIIEEIRKAGHGKVELTITDGKITHIIKSQSFKIN